MTRVEGIEIQRLRISRGPLELHFNPFRRSRIVDEPERRLHFIAQTGLLIDRYRGLVECPFFHGTRHHVGDERESGRAEHAFNPAGGLHHAMPARASGFCVYDDPAIAIAWLLAKQSIEF